MLILDLDLAVSKTAFPDIKVSSLSRVTHALINLLVQAKGMVPEQSIPFCRAPYRLPGHLQCFLRV